MGNQEEVCPPGIVIEVSVDQVNDQLACLGEEIIVEFVEGRPADQGLGCVLQGRHDECQPFRHRPTVVVCERDDSATGRLHSPIARSGRSGVCLSDDSEIKVPRPAGGIQHQRRAASVVRHDHFEAAGGHRLRGEGVEAPLDGTRPVAGRNRVSREAIHQAAAAACADAFIETLPDGYDTVIGEQGHRLSRGQRQRLSLARAMLRQPEILILDEATSALDSNTEARVHQAIEAFRSGRTVLAVAHRLSSIRAADQILVLEAGRIVERGSHDQLLTQAGAYAGLWRRQQGRPETSPARPPGTSP